MSGPWKPDPVISTDHPAVKETVYIKEDRVLISFGNFSDEPHAVLLQIDWDRIGIDPGEASPTAPEIDDFQKNQEFRISERIPVRPRKGFLLYLSDGRRQFPINP